MMSAPPPFASALAPTVCAFQVAVRDQLSTKARRHRLAVSVEQHTREPAVEGRRWRGCGVAPAPVRRSGLLALVQEVQDAISGLVCYVFCQLRGGFGFAFKRVDTSNSMIFRSRPMRWSSLV